MTRSEWESLMQAFGGEAVRSDIDGLLRALVASQSSEPAGAVTRDAPGSSTGLAAEVRSVVVAPVADTLEPPVQFSAPPVPTGAAPSTQETSDERSVASNVMQTIGMITGVGPVVTGLLKLFGGGGRSDVSPAYAPVPFSLPEQVAVEAGLAQDRSFVGVGYSAQGAVRAVPPTARAASSAAQIQINVNAMDSRSFADHSDDIARAVREAMLRSHTLNDVIAEI
jgi:hypothetical protein